MCCVFQPAFGCCAYPKAGWNTSFWPFGPFLFISNVLQWFFGWNQEKLFRNVWKKQCFKLLFKGGWHESTGRLPILTEKCLKWTNKGRKWPKKLFKPALGAHSSQKLVQIHNIYDCYFLFYFIGMQLCK